MLEDYGNLADRVMRGEQRRLMRRELCNDPFVLVLCVTLGAMLLLNQLSQHRGR